MRKAQGDGGSYQTFLVRANVVWKANKVEVIIIRMVINKIIKLVQLKIVDRQDQLAS
jgi:hypothetical protein